MAARWTNRPFSREVPFLLKQRKMSIRALARSVDVTDAHLLRVLRQVNYKSASGDLARRVALALELAEDYFPEYREAFVVERVRGDGRFRDSLYRRLTRR